MKTAATGVGAVVAWMLGVIAVIAIFFAIALATVGLHSATAGLFGRANVHIQNESAPNRIVQQASFEQQYADVTKFKGQITDAKAVLISFEKDNADKADNAIGTMANQHAKLVDEVVGLRQQCQRTVADYNADTNKLLSKDWRDKHLPDTLDLSDCS